MTTPTDYDIQHMNGNCTLWCYPVYVTWKVFYFHVHVPCSGCYYQASSIVFKSQRVSDRKRLKWGRERGREREGESGDRQTDRDKDREEGGGGGGGGEGERERGLCLNDKARDSINSVNGSVFVVGGVWGGGGGTYERTWMINLKSLICTVPLKDI